MSGGEPDDPTDNSEQQVDEQATDSNQSAGEAEEQPADGDQSGAQSDEQLTEQTDQSTEQSEEELADRDQPAEQAEDQATDSDQQTEQVEEQADSDQPATSASTDDTAAFPDSDVSTVGGGGRGGAGATIEIRGSPFGGPYTPGFVTAEASFKSCIHVPDDLTVALVDVTDPSAPVYAGIRDQDTVFIASMAKIAALYAAFELRKQLQDAISNVPTSIPVANLIAEVRKTWQPLLDATKPNDRAAFSGFPSLSEIFDITPSGSSWSVEFTTRGDIGTLPDAEFAEWTLLKGKFGFKELLELMARFSNNDASARCITALSYEYIHGALTNAGLYNEATGGLWLGAPYPHKPGAALTEGLWAAEPLNNERNQSRKYQMGSAEAAARMFTLLAQGNLVDATASSEMLDMLDTGTNDFVRNALAADKLLDGSPARPVKLSRTKIGVIDKSYYSQTSLVERDPQDHGNPIRYVISVLNNNIPPFYINKDTIVPLDQCILNRHPGATPPPP
jgi:Beta-lactamase enzyme family